MNTQIYKKEFQLDVNNPLADISMGYIVNKFEYVWVDEGPLYGEVQVNKFARVQEGLPI